MSQLAWIGLGNIGRGMVKNLAEKGSLSSPLIIWNRTASKAEDLAKSLKNVTVASTANEAISKADIVFICIAADKDVEQIVSEAIRAGDDHVKGKLFVDCSTVHPDTTTKINKMLHDAGAEFVACPVFGAPPMAEAGQLVTVLAGPKAAVDRVKPFTKGVVSRADIDFSGQEPGHATLLKIIGNTFILQMIEALSEGHTLAEKTGLGVENLHKFVEIMFPGPYTKYSERMMSGDYYNRESPAFHATLARKDSGHALRLAKEAGVKLKAVELADAHLAEVEKLRPKNGDIAGVYGAVRVEAGLPYENNSKE